MNKKQIEIFKEGEKKINNIKDLENLEEIKSIISEIKINKLKIIDNTEYKNFETIKKEILQIINEIFKLNKINKNLNLEGEIKKFIPDDIKNDNFIDINKLKNSIKKEELIESIKNLKIYNCDIFKIEAFKNNINDFQYNSNIEKYIDQIKEKFFESNLNFIFTKEEKPFFLHVNMKINFGIYVMMDNISNDIGTLKIKNNSKINIYFKLIQKDNKNLIQTNIKNESIKNLKKYEDLEIKFTLLEKREGLKKAHFDLILLDNGLQESNKCSIEVIIYVIPLLLKFSLNNENY